MTRLAAGLAAALAASALAACSSNETGGTSETPAAPESVDWSQLPQLTSMDPELEGLGGRLESFSRLCARGRGDGFATALCATGSPPLLTNLTDLLELVNLGPDDSRAFALSGNSTSLVTQSVSSINPRIIVFPRVGSDLERPEVMTAVGFVRGEQFVELVGRDPTTDDLNFYLLHFEQNCNYQENGCNLASLLTEAIEHDWTAYSIYDQQDLEGTSFDCLSCHQPEGHGTKLILRMQELESPWLHWFPQRLGQRTETDRVLLAQFAEAHALDTQYGGIPVATITNALDEGSGAQLEALVRAEGFDQQPNPFDARIAAEAKGGESPTWDERFGAHLRGEAIAVPYPAIDVTDETKRAAAVSSYLAVIQGTSGPETLLDLRDVFSSDAASKLSFVPWAPGDGRSVMMQMCARCHDGRGNPELEKNQFDVLRLDEMSREMKDRAISRVTATGRLRMPPWRTGTLSQESIDAVVAELSK